MKLHSVFLFITVLVILFNVAVFARFGDTNWPCDSDAKKYCATANGQDEITACLKKISLKLTPDCKKELAANAVKDNEPDCEDDKNKEKEIPDEDCMPDGMVFEEIKPAK